MLNSARMEALTLRFTRHEQPELTLAPGMHGIGRIGEDVDAIGLVEASEQPIVCFCVDRRGVWLTVSEGARGVHVNGRQVRRMAMLRLGDAIYVDGVEMLLVSDRPIAALPASLKHAALDSEGDPRVVLRGVGGQYHGRSFTLEAPRLVGRTSDADIRIDDPAFADRHARLELFDDAIVLRDLGSVDGSMVNGVSVRDAIMRPGDQIVFDAHHRFVIEAPARPSERNERLPVLDDPHDFGMSGAGAGTPLRRSARRLPWLLLAALLLAAALSALLLFGSH
ncbi:MAG: FHA domain-containing protein [Luteimonas sp.]